MFSAVKQEEMEDWMAVFTVSALVAYMHACREREVQNLRGASISQCRSKHRIALFKDQVHILHFMHIMFIVMAFCCLIHNYIMYCKVRVMLIRIRLFIDQKFF